MNCLCDEKLVNDVDGDKYRIIRALGGEDPLSDTHTEDFIDEMKSMGFDGEMISMGSKFKTLDRGMDGMGGSRGSRERRSKTSKRREREAGDMDPEIDSLYKICGEWGWNDWKNKIFAKGRGIEGNIFEGKPGFHRLVTGHDGRGGWMTFWKEELMVYNSSVKAASIVVNAATAAALAATAAAEAAKAAATAAGATPTAAVTAAVIETAAAETAAKTTAMAAQVEATEDMQLQIEEILRKYKTEKLYTLAPSASFASSGFKFKEARPRRVDPPLRNAIEPDENRALDQAELLDIFKDFLKMMEIKPLDYLQFENAELAVDTAAGKLVGNSFSLDELIMDAREAGESAAKVALDTPTTPHEKLTKISEVAQLEAAQVASATATASATPVASATATASATPVASSTPVASATPIDTEAFVHSVKFIAAMKKTNEKLGTPTSDKKALAVAMGTMTCDFSNWNKKAQVLLSLLSGSTDATPTERFNKDYLFIMFLYWMYMPGYVQFHMILRNSLSKVPNPCTTAIDINHILKKDTKILHDPIHQGGALTQVYTTHPTTHLKRSETSGPSNLGYVGPIRKYYKPKTECKKVFALCPAQQIVREPYCYLTGICVEDTSKTHIDKSMQKADDNKKIIKRNLENQCEHVLGWSQFCIYVQNHPGINHPKFIEFLGKCFGDVLANSLVQAISKYYVNIQCYAYAPSVAIANQIKSDKELVKLKRSKATKTGIPKDMGIVKYKLVPDEQMFTSIYKASLTGDGHYKEGAITKILQTFPAALYKKYVPNVMSADLTTMLNDGLWDENRAMKSDHKTRCQNLYDEFKLRVGKISDFLNATNGSNKVNDLKHDGPAHFPLFSDFVVSNSDYPDDSDITPPAPHYNPVYCHQNMLKIINLAVLTVILITNKNCSLPGSSKFLEKNGLYWLSLFCLCIDTSNFVASTTGVPLIMNSVVLGLTATDKTSNWYNALNDYFILTNTPYTGGGGGSIYIKSKRRKIKSKRRKIKSRRRRSKRKSRKRIKSRKTKKSKRRRITKRKSRNKSK